MVNPTVREVIEALQKMNPDALFCTMVWESERKGEWGYSTIEILKEIGETEYCDDAGDIKKGNVVAVY